MPHVLGLEPKQMPFQFVLVNLLLELIADELSALNLFSFILLGWINDKKKERKKEKITENLER